MIVETSVSRATMMAFGCALAIAGPVRASDAVAEAEIYGDKAIDAFKEGNYDLACPLFEKSLGFKTRAGTLYLLAECEAKRNRLATASSVFQNAIRFIDALPEAERIKDVNVARLDKAREWLSKNKPRVPRVVLRLPEGVAEEVKPQVILDGKELPATAVGEPWDVDPGNHTVVVQAEGYKRWTGTFGVAAAQKVVVPIRPGPSIDRRLAYAVGGAGAALFLMGVGFAAASSSAAASVTAQCPNKICSPEGRQAVDNVSSYGAWADFGLGAGLVGLIAGTYLYVQAGAPVEATAIQTRSSDTRGSDRELSSVGFNWTPVLAPTAQGGIYLGMTGGF